MSWTSMFALKAIVFVGIAIMMMVTDNPLVLHHEHWIMVATYALTGVVLLLVGMLLDARSPQKIKVLVRHDGRAWLLNVVRSHTGQLYAPQDDDLRIARPINLNDAAQDILGCPYFTTTLQLGDDGRIHRIFRVLGKVYTTQT